MRTEGIYALELLGPLALRRAGVALPLPTQKSQALLLLLALGGAAHRSRLAAWLWPHTDETAARRNLRRELARLREVGAAGALHSEGELLALSDEVRCDVVSFGVALADGRPEDALALWRGPPVDGLQLDGADAFEDWLGGERAKLQTRRRTALQVAARAAESRGDSVAALAQVQALLADDPLQEHHHRDAMRLLAAAGQREAALAQYARCREVLASELGLAPTTETQALVAQLRQGPVAASAAAAQASAPDGPPGLWTRELPLVGRDVPWQALAAAWAEGRTLLVEGVAGIGKTRLAREFAASRGAFALAQCRRSDAGVPYASFTRALRQMNGQDLARSDLAPWVRLELSHLLPELGNPPQRIGSAEEQRRFFEACAAAWQTLSAGSFDTVIVDDWHHADEASRALLEFIVVRRHETRASAAGIDAGARPTAAREIFVLRPELDAAAQARLKGLADGVGALRLSLAPLAADHVLELVRQLSGAREPRRFAQRLERATGGNPFFVAETLRQWQGLQLVSVGADGVWETPFDGATPDYGELPVPDSVRDAVIARVQRQPDTVRRLLEAAALAAEPFTPSLLAGACAMSEVEALTAIEHAVAAELLRERDGGYAFVHDLVQTALDSALPADRRRLVHRRLALGAEAAGLAPAAVAHHWEAGGEPQRAVAFRLAAAEAALALYGDADAEAHWQAALADGPTLAQRLQVLGQRWQLHRNREDHPALLQAVADLDALHDQALAQSATAELAVDAALHAAEILSHMNRAGEALPRVQACLAETGLGTARRARALRIASQALSRLGRTAEAQQATEEALAAGGLTPVQQGEMLHAMSYTCFLRGLPSQSLAYARRALAFWQAAGDRRLVARAQASIARSLDMLDEQPAAWTELERAYAMAAELRIVGLQREVANNLANNRVNLGEPARAVAVIREAWALSPHFSMAAMPVFYLGILVKAHGQLGELDTALDLSDDALQRARALGEAMTLADHACMVLDVHVLAGDAEGAARILAGLDMAALQGLGYIRIKLGFNLFLHALRSGNLDAARALLHGLGEVEALEQPPDRAAARLCHAQLALAEGQPDAALRWLQPLRGRALYCEVLAQSCTARLAAWRLLGQARTQAVAGSGMAATTEPTPAAATEGLTEAIRLADAALASGTLPALLALELQHERCLAAELASDLDTASRLRSTIATMARALAANLAARPALQAAFLARWAPHVG